MRIILGFTLLLLLAPSIHAEMYKSVDEEGNVVYSDKETPDSEKIVPDALITIPSTKIEPKKPEAKEETGETKYTSFKITSPANDATVRDNNGTMQVTLSSKPKLDVKAGHSVAVFVDGKRVVNNAKQLSINVTDIYRGSHQVHAAIRNKNNKTIIKSNSVRFHMKRHIVPRPTQLPSSALDSDTPPGAIAPGPRGTYYKPGPVVVVQPEPSG